VKSLAPFQSIKAGKIPHEQYQFPATLQERTEFVLRNGRAQKAKPQQNAIAVCSWFAFVQVFPERRVPGFYRNPKINGKSFKAAATPFQY